MQAGAGLRDQHENAFEVVTDVGIGDAQGVVVVGFEPLVAGSIAFVCAIVRTAVHFHEQASGRAVEVGDVLVQNHLPTELVPVAFAISEVCPQPHSMGVMGLRNWRARSLSWGWMRRRFSSGMVLLAQRWGLLPSSGLRPPSPCKGEGECGSLVG